MLITILVFILILSVLVLVHEAGHFLTAKKLGIKVEEFGFGFPPRAWSKKLGETIYSLNWLPLGGFVKLYGEDEAGGGQIGIKKQVTKIKNDWRAFISRPAWQRALVIVMGVVMNFILGALILAYLIATVGIAKQEKGILVIQVLKNSPSFSAGIKKGDIILSSNNHIFVSPQDLIAYTKKRLGEKIDLKIKRLNGKIDKIKIIPRVKYASNQGPMGIAIDYNFQNVKKVWYEALIYGAWEGLKTCWLIILGIWQALKEVFIFRKTPSGLAGPIGIAELTGQFIKLGPKAILSLVSLLSFNLAVLNILPIPALDGGRFFFILWEIITRKKINPEFEAKIHGFGMIVLFGLIILITIHDVGRLITGQPLLK